MVHTDWPAVFLGFVANRRGVELGDLAGKIKVRHVPVPTRLMYAVWNALRAPHVDRLLGGLDLYHATNYYLPPVQSAKTVMTIHDLGFLVQPSWTSREIVAPFRDRLADFLQRADAVLTYSRSTAADVVRYFQVPSEKITITPMGIDEAFRPVRRAIAKSRMEQEWGIPGPFLLFVSTLEPRKNVVGLIRVFERIAKEYPHQLVLVGSTGWKAEGILRAIEESPVRDRIIRPGFVPHLALPAFYSAADAFLFPTNYEGFGLPLLEALTCGCPVVSTNVSSVPEVVGEAALLAEPGQMEAFYELTEQLLSDSSIRERLVETGKIQASRFSWQKCAAETLRTYEFLTSAS